MFGLRAARLFDGHELVDDPVVAIDGTQIVAVSADVPADIAVEDLGNVTLMPGLIDTHQHLCFSGVGTLEQQVVDIDDAELLARARANAQRALRAGITTIRDLGDRDFLTLALREDIELPTIVAAGPPITLPDGHCWFLGGGCDGRDALVAAVRERHRRGCEVVKIMVTGGHHTPNGLAMWDSQFDTDDVTAIVDAAHTLGMTVAAHCHGIRGTASAVEAGVDTIEHGSFFTDEGRCEPDADVITAIVKGRITVSATLGQAPGAAVPPVIEANLPAIRDGFRQIHEAGGIIAVGTDAGIGPAKPHDVLAHSARDLEQIGMRGIELLATYTSVAAAACGVADRKGRLASGYDADLIAVPGDAVTNSSALLDVQRVWRAGAVVAA